jgi:hypothetical protein
MIISTNRGSLKVSLDAGNNSITRLIIISGKDTPEDTSAVDIRGVYTSIRWEAFARIVIYIIGGPTAADIRAGIRAAPIDRGG